MLKPTGIEDVTDGQSAECTNLFFLVFILLLNADAEDIPIHLNLQK